MNLIVLGAPGAGKGAQSRNLSEHYHIPNLSTGDLLREEMKNKTEMGISIEKKMAEGSLIPDEIVTKLLKERLLNDDCKKGFILDGYPRNLNQADILRTIAKIDRAIYFFVPDEIIIGRMSDRYICPDCAAVFNLRSKPPKEHLKCDFCGGDLYQREDDKPKIVQRRLEIYHDVTEPIIEYYKSKGILLEVDGTKEILEVTKDIISLLGVVF